MTWLRRPAGGIALRVCIGLCALVASGGSFGRAQRAAGVEDVRSALDRGAFAEAERAGSEVSTRVQEQHGAESLASAQAQDLLVEALLRNGHAGADRTLALANDVLALKERLRGPDDLETALSLHNLGDVRLERGELAAAASLHERGLSIRLKQLPANDAAVADSLDRLALVQTQREQWDDARKTLAKAQAIREAWSEQSPLALARALELVGWLDRYSGSYAAAARPVERALELRRQRAPQHPDVIPLLELRGDLLYSGAT